MENMNVVFLDGFGGVCSLVCMLSIFFREYKANAASGVCHSLLRMSEP